MGIINRWLIKQLMKSCGLVFELIGNVTADTFSNVAIKGILSGMKTIGYSLYAVSLLICCIKLLSEIMDDKDISFGDLVTRILIGAAAVEFGVKIMQTIYLAFLEGSKSIIDAVTLTTELKWNFTESMGGASSILLAIMAGILLFYLTKVFLGLLERFWNFIIVVVLLYLFIPGYVTGNDEGIIGWFKSCIAIGMTQIFQISIVIIGMSFFVSDGSLTNFCLALGAAISASKVDQLLDKWGSASGGKAGAVARNGMSSAFYARSMFKA